MTFIQNLFKRILPSAWAADMEAESRQWMIRCNVCGYERSVWDAGGIRWKATPGDKQTLVHCPECGELKGARITKGERS